MGHFLLAVILVFLIMLFIGGLMMFYSLLVCVCMCAITQLCTKLTRKCLCVFQLCVQRSVSTVAVCLLIHASVSLVGADSTAPVVSALS